MASFILTFGDGQPNRGRYTVIEATDKQTAVDLGYELYGNDWSQAYPEADGLRVVARWNLNYIEPPALRRS